MKDLIAATRALLIEKGWCQYTSASPSGSVCLGQAVCLATEGAGLVAYGPFAARIASDPLLQERAPQESPSMDRIVRFNDHPLTTGEDVLSLLDRVEATMS